jgi:heptaprenyl diphosphate synthase
MRALLPVEFSDPDLAGYLTDGLAVVEDRMREAVGGPHPVLATAARHLIDAGGNRMCPLLAAQFGPRRDARVTASAVAVDLIHLATLYHDDVMDGAAVRRGCRAPTRCGRSCV